jgi:hypothetical protein
MKEKKSLIAWLLIKIIILLIVITFQNVSTKKELTKTKTELLEVLSERNHLDSLYRDHLSVCSFISRKEVAIDSRGYFYSTYRKDPKKTD